MVKTEHVIQARGIKKSYAMGKRTLEVLRGVDLSVRAGELLAVMGASGSGKSTLLHILGLLDRADEGKVEFEGRDVSDMGRSEQDRIRNRQIGFVFQFYHLLPELNVLENVMLPGMVGSSVITWAGQKAAAKKRAKDLLHAVGLSDQFRQKPVTLSGGERQRVAIARALMQNPKLLLADAPTGNLDANAGKMILDLLSQLNQKGQTIIMVTHDVSIAERAHRKIVLRDGRLV